MDSRHKASNLALQPFETNPVHLSGIVCVYACIIGQRVVLGGRGWGGG